MYIIVLEQPAARHIRTAVEHEIMITDRRNG